MSASVTGLPLLLSQRLYSPPYKPRAISPASRTLSSSNATSRTSASGAGNGHALDPQRRCVRAVVEDQVIGRRQVQEHVLEVAGDGDLRHRISDLPVLDPVAGGAAAVIAGDAIDSHADQLGHIEALFDVGYECLGCERARFH